MKIDIRTDEAKAKDILKDKKNAKRIEASKNAKDSRSRSSRGVREDRPLGWNDGVRENVHTWYNYDGSNWQRTVAENGSVVFTQRRPLGQPPYEIGQRYNVDQPVSDIITGSILVVAGVDEQTLTMVYHITGAPSRTITMNISTADYCLTFIESDGPVRNEGNSGDVSTPEYAAIIGVCFVVGFVVTVMATAIGSVLF